MTTISDFKPGQTVRVLDNEFTRPGTFVSTGLTVGGTYTVKRVVPQGVGGSLLLDEIAEGSHRRGSYGFLLFEVVSQPAEVETPAADAPTLSVQHDGPSATLKDGTVVHIGSQVRVNSDQYGYNKAPVDGMDHDSIVTVTEIGERNLGSGGWIINGVGFEWFTAPPVADVPVVEMVAADEIPAIRDALTSRVTDFKVGDFVVVTRASLVARNSGLEVGMKLRVAGVHPLPNMTPGAGTITVDGIVNKDSIDGWEPGSFGHLIFSPFVEKIVDAPRDLVVGDKVRITNARTNINDDFDGALATVAAVDDSAAHDGYPYRLESDDSRVFGQWSRKALDLVEDAPGIALGDALVANADAQVAAVEAPARPLIDFSGSSRATAREYAANHVSRVNKPETNTILTEVSAGDTVDAYTLAEALLDAMRGATTRAGDSLRRIHSREIAYLGHIVHAALANHADNLPAYPAGERSRAVDDARAAVAEAQSTIETMRTNFERDFNEVSNNLEAEIANRNRLEAERTTLTQAASDERRRLCDEINDLKARLTASEKRSDDGWALAAENDAVITYLSGLGENIDSAVTVFRAGYHAGRD